jgi:hypothetical protein
MQHIHQRVLLGSQRKRKGGREMGGLEGNKNM